MQGKEREKWRTNRRATPADKKAIKTFYVKLQNEVDKMDWGEVKVPKLCC